MDWSMRDAEIMIEMQKIICRKWENNVTKTSWITGPVRDQSILQTTRISIASEVVNNYKLCRISLRLYKSKP